MQDTYLICCIGVASSEWFSKAFLRHFVEHYLAMGILPSNFLLTLHSAADDGNVAWCRNWLSAYGISPLSDFDGEYDCYQFYERNFAIMRKLPTNAWILLVDFDELIFFPEGLPHFIRRLENNGFDLVMGHLVDRVGPQGRLEAIAENNPIWDQFPHCFRLTRDIVRGDERKTCLFRNHLTPSLGHHYVREAAAATCFPTDLSVYHFKWDSTLPCKLAKRLDQFDQNRAKYPWYGEVYNVLRSIEGDRLVLPSELPPAITTPSLTEPSGVANAS